MGERLVQRKLSLQDSKGFWPGGTTNRSLALVPRQKIAQLNLFALSSLEIHPYGLPKDSTSEKQ
jgi:hypothetical protein